MSLIEIFRFGALLWFFFVEFFGWLLVEDAVEALDLVLINRIAARYFLNEAHHGLITIHFKIVVVIRFDIKEHLFRLREGRRAENLLFH